MRVLQAHNFYQFAGGEDAVVSNEQELLLDHGNEVRLYSVSNDEIKGLSRKIHVAWQASYSPSSKAQVSREITAFGPDVVHVHNFFPLISPSIYDACHQAGVPVVQTLHNYRSICPAAILLREGRLCEDCVHGTAYQAVQHACYRGSRLASLAVARMVDVHRRKGTWRNKVDRFIALTRFAKTKFVEAGFPENKIAIKPNFVKVRGASGTEDAKSNGALFVGRLSAEKGIRTLLKAWSSLDVPLQIVGDGPLLETVCEQQTEIIVSLGSKAPDEVATEMKNASFLVMPSECYEAFGLTIVEAFSQALPVIASRLGAMAEIVEDGVTGLHFTPGDPNDLAAKVRWAAKHPEKMRRMGLNARQVYEEKYTPELNYRQLISIYEMAIDQYAKHNTGPDIPG